MELERLFKTNSDAVADKVRAMRHLAFAKAAAANGAPEFVAEIERRLDAVAFGKLAGMAPVNENLLGLAYMLLGEVRRSRT